MFRELNDPADDVGPLHPSKCQRVGLTRSRRARRHTAARELNADFLVMDELDGRAAARACGLTVIGTLGLLELAAVRGKVDFREVLRRLRGTNFYASLRLIDEFLERDRLRREKREGKQR